MKAMKKFRLNLIHLRQVKEPATSENVQVHPVIITVIGDIVPNPPINNEQNKIGCSLISYKGYLLNINKIQNKVGKENYFSL